ncbi:hypothetical protein [Polaromonas sp.]|uniref:hypothetical protein n=1 Tax=Polaromonas sp. TaxID=1869339 RepID=UPI00273023F5|nr:hypothetical protein [Polaromonas sp.]MDP2448765.1 hypothetical protein [Polaromonas sp.]MDP3756329.1 hypothetical protein [Polaromonas sp.]
MFTDKSQQLAQVVLAGRSVVFLFFLPSELVAQDILPGIKQGSAHKVFGFKHQASNLVGGRR